MLKRNINYDEFQYVVQRSEQKKVCFGSGKERSTHILIEGAPSVGPLSYHPEKYTNIVDQFLAKPRSKKGVGGLASGAPRFSNRVLLHVPSPTRYEVAHKYPPPTSGGPPFGKTAKRGHLKFTNNPGPGTYDLLPQKCRRSRKKYNLGNVAMVPATECICVPSLGDVCSKCSQVCDNDYWQQNDSVYLCHVCMAEEKELHEMYPESQLRKFKKIRNCSYKHHHEATFAAIKLLPEHKIKKKERLENYLDLYLKCFSK